MDAATFPRSAGHKPALAAFAATAAFWVFVLVTLGAFTTTIGAGMAFQDWPLSNGSLNPKGWLSNLAMFAEHSHRLSAGLMTFLTAALAVWIWVTESRRWMRRLAWFAIGLVLAQALLGGLRVLLDHIQVRSLETSVGRLLAMLHACVAQAFACTLIGLAISSSKAWISRPFTAGAGVRKAGMVCCAVLFVQLAVAAVMRHSFAGMAIPTFPWSTPQGALLPEVWNFRVAIQFAHRVLAGVVAVAVVVYAAAIWRDRTLPVAMRSGASVLVSLVAFQILLGATIIRTFRDPYVTTAHVLVGALTLVTAFCLNWYAHRDAIEASAAP